LPAVWHFIIVQLTFTNNGKEAVTLDSASLAILDDKGRTHKTDTDASMYVPTNRQKKRGNTTFNGGGIDTFVTKLNASGSVLAYSTFLGGTGGELVGFLGIEVDGRGRTYVTGATSSADFPTTPGAFDTTFNGGFVTKLPTG
jgi:hypothetical protein